MSQKKWEKEVKELKEQTTVVQKDVTRMTKSEKKVWKADKEYWLDKGFAVKESEQHLLHTSSNITKPEQPVKPKSLGKRILSSAAKAPLGFAISSIKKVGQKADPLNKPVNKNDVADTGAESLRLANNTVKKTKKTIKTTKNTAYTVKRTAKTTVKAAQYTFKFVYEVAAQAVAIVINPIFLFIAAVVIMIVMIAGLLVLIIGGHSSNEQAMTTADGLGESTKKVAEQYKNAEDFYDQAVSERKQGFERIINDMYYNASDIEHSHLVYFERVKPNHAVLPKCFAKDENKTKIKDRWDYQIEKEDLIAIAYVWLEQKANEDKQTYLKIYDVEFKQDMFIDLVQQTVPISYIIHDNQECPDHNCTRDPELLRKWQESQEKANQTYASFNPYWDAYNGYISVDEWWNRFGWLMDGNYPYFDNDGNDYRDYIASKCGQYKSEADHFKWEYENSVVCTHQHRLHNVGIAFWTKDELMDALGFDDTYKYWVELTKQGFENNPDIP